MERRRCSLLLVSLLASALLCSWTFAPGAESLGFRHQQFPSRNTSAHPNCSQEPGFPRQYVGGFFFINEFPSIASIDANGCNSWTSGVALSFGAKSAFFAGPGFKAGLVASQYGTRETTEVIDGHQLIRVVDPSKTWLRVYKGFDQCMSGRGSSGGNVACVAPAVERRPDDWVPYLPAAIILAAVVLFVIHFLRPAGPIRRRRHYRRTSQDLVLAVPGDDPAHLESLDIKQLQKRLRHLEQAIAPELAESQHHWFKGLLSTGRHGMALESLTRWFAESHLPVPDHVRDETLWLASSLQIEHLVRPVLDAQVEAHIEDPQIPDSVSPGFDVPLADFKKLVAEAVDSLPPAFGRAMTNVAILIDEENPKRNVLGLYEGLPLSRRIVHTWSVHPDKITIYRRAICDRCRSETEVRAMVYRTVIHEIAHHFGIDDPRLRELGW